MKMIPLKTLKGSKIWYSKYGVGKEIGGKIYVHKDYALDVLPTDVWNDAESIMLDFMPNFKYNCICWSPKTPSIVRFDAVLDFDDAREPVVGDMCYVNTETFHSDMKINIRHSVEIFHHKWLWVKPNYQGFDTELSYLWSNLWLSKFKEVASGYPNKWEEQLEKYFKIG